MNYVLDIKTKNEDTLKIALDQKTVAHHWYLLPKG